MIYYVAFYNPKEEIGKRIANYAGEDKIDYICEVLNKNGEDVTVLSNTKSVDSKFQGRKLYNISDKKKVMMFSSISNINKLIHAIDVVWGYLQLSGYLIKNLRKDDTVIVYHSLGYRRLFNVISKIRKFNYILEVEELFQYIDSANAFKKKESTVFSSPNAFIFSNAIIEQAVNKENKPYVVVNGIYKNEKIITQKPNINKIRVLYAGNLDRQKGVDYVIQTAKYLSDSFELKIIGFGSDADIDRVNNLILESNNNSKCKVYFDGVFKGDEYISYVQQCDIGVCIQEPNDKFNLYEFPSKIFSYMSNGLKVVVNKLEQIENCYIKDFLFISESNDPKLVANAIIDASEHTVDSKKILDELNNKFINDMKKMIREEVRKII